MPPPQICPDCGKSLKIQKGLSIHRFYCTARKATVFETPSLGQPESFNTRDSFDTQDSYDTHNLLVDGNESVQLDISDCTTAGVALTPEPDDPDLSCLPDQSKTRYHPRRAGESFGVARRLYRKHLSEDWNPWHPFQNAEDFELAWWMMECGLTKEAIDRYLQRGLDHDACVSFHSADQLWTLLENVDFGFGPRSWSVFKCEFGTLYARDILKCVQFLLGHLPFAEHTAYAPVQLFDSTGRRVYSEIHTGDWWWEMQDRIPEGGTIVPLIFASDKTQLTNYSGDKSAWPLYMSIGNISKDIRRQSSKRAWVLVGLLPIPKNPKDGDIQRTWHQAIGLILEPIKGLDLEGPGYEWDCADGAVRRCYPVIAAWIADYQEHIILARIRNGRCPICEIPRTEMGHESGARLFEHRNPASYKAALKRGTREDLEILEYVGVRAEVNPLWDLPLCNVYQLWQPDVLHLLLLSILKTLIEWLVAYLKELGLLDRFNHRFKSIPAYPGFYEFNRTYSEVCTWQGKEIRTMMRFLLAVVGPLLSERIQSKKSEEAEALQCVRSMCEFFLVIGQRNHSEYTLRLLDDFLATFYRTKSIFRRQRKTAARVKKFEELWVEKVRQATEQKWSNSRIQREQEKLESEVYHFQFPKMHLLSHVTQSIRRMGSPDNFSTEIPELLHSGTIKEAYRASNKVNYEEQILWYNDRYSGLDYMVQTLQYIASRGLFNYDSSRALRMQSRTERIKSSRFARLRRRAGQQPELVREMPMPEVHVRVDQTPQITTLAAKTRLKMLTLRQASNKFGIYDLPMLFCDRVEELWGPGLTEKILGSPITFADSMKIQIYNAVANFYQPFQRPLEIEKRYLRCAKEGRRAAKTHSVWVRVNEDRTLDSFQGRKACIPLLYFAYKPSQSTLSRTRLNKKRDLVSRTLELVMLVGTKYATRSGLPNRYHGFVEVVLNPQDRYVAEVESIEGPVQLVEVDERRRTGKVWIVNSHIDLDTYYYVY